MEKSFASYKFIRDNDEDKATYHTTEKILNKFFIKKIHSFVRFSFWKMYYKSLLYVRKLIILTGDLLLIELSN